MLNLRCSVVVESNRLDRPHGEARAGERRLNVFCIRSEDDGLSSGRRGAGRAALEAQRMQQRRLENLLR
jgi:hypothetical protein